MMEWEKIMQREKKRKDVMEKNEARQKQKKINVAREKAKRKMAWRKNEAWEKAKKKLDGKREREKNALTWKKCDILKKNELNKEMKIIEIDIPWEKGREKSEQRNGETNKEVVQ